jgi:hypothetical protein
MKESLTSAEVQGRFQRFRRLKVKGRGQECPRATETSWSYICVWNPTSAKGRQMWGTERFRSVVKAVDDLDGEHSGVADVGAAEGVG